MNYQSLLTGLQLETRLDLAAAVKSGSCTIQFDGTLDVTLDAGDRDGEKTLLYLHAVIGTTPDIGGEALLTRLLQLHLFGLATHNGVFGLEPQSNHVLFFQTIDLSRLTDQEALAGVEAFVNQAVRWREYLPQLHLAALPENSPAHFVETA
ncbi:type III secretion system chaperone [Robbsia sp. Bb-Pol-6]|uniref:Type III secretion system chaperone n=1 Tax=Robbsia betulipollinis TaxID=2981849 RepID=A0ABT3ZQU5_9BURK|nr:type III secretion system chaperone [Robbsia betulipollinis]MCY0388263.1 type III secretion system chaperone [Robbsia betulipollinis]